MEEEFFKFIHPNVLTADQAGGRPLEGIQLISKVEVIHIFSRFLHTKCQSSWQISLFKVNLHTKKIYLPNAALLSTKCVATARASLHNVKASFLEQQFLLGTLDGIGTIRSL